METFEAGSLGPLRVRITGSPTPKRWVVLCHGYGAPGTDLVPLAQELCHMEKSLGSHTLFVFPEAPISLSMGMPWMESRAWWHIDIGRFEKAIRTGQLQGLTEDTPDGLPGARKKLLQTLDAIAERYHLSFDSLTLGGFSQGAMLTTDTALRMPNGPGKLCILSGTLLSAREWKQLAAEKHALPVFQSHGADDPILPVQVAEWLRDALEEADFPVQFVPFQGGHGIPHKVLKALGVFLR